MKKIIAAAIAAIALSGCEPELTAEELAAETAYVTVTPPAETETVTVTATETVNAFPDTTQYGPEGKRNVHFYGDRIHAWITKCYVSPDGVIVEYQIKNNDGLPHDFAGNVSVTVDGRQVAVGGLWVPKIAPGETAGNNSFINYIPEGEFTCSFVNVVHADLEAYWTQAPGDNEDVAWTAPTP